MLLAAYMVCGFGLASIYAISWLKGRRDRRPRLGLIIPFTIAAIATPIQIFVGDVAARGVADHQPAKFAGFECIQETGPNQTEWIMGICTDDGVKFGIPLPGVDSLLVGFSTGHRIGQRNPELADPGATDSRGRAPPATTLLHLAFDTMVGIGFTLLGLASWFAWSMWRRQEAA